MTAREIRELYGDILPPFVIVSNPSPVKTQFGEIGAAIRRRFFFALPGGKLSS